MEYSEAHLSEIVEQLDAVNGLDWVARHIPQTAFSSALGEEDQVITHMIATQKLPIRIFTLDTGRLFNEAYELIDLTKARYAIDMQVYFPESKSVEQYVSEKGINAFYHSVENRKACCQIRKVEPLKRALKNTAVWITGIRAEQSGNRQQMKKIEWDAAFNVIKYNPLLDWTYQDLQAYIETNNIPTNSLHKKGFVSIGCAPCTRAIQPDEDIRAGRWWWESSAKECGLHQTKAPALKTA